MGKASGAWNWEDVKGKMAAGASRYWPLLVLVALFVAVQWPVLAQWWGVWNAPDSYFSHGPLIPFIVGYMIWANRKRMEQTPIRPAWAGVVVLIVAIGLFLVGRWAQSFSFNALSFMLMIFGILLVSLGVGLTRLLAIPMLFLGSMIPVASSWLDSATAKLQLQSAAVASKFLEYTGYPNQLMGTTIESDGLPQPLIVGVPCSGLRTLISLITFTVFFVYMIRAPWWKKGILLVLSFPLSIFINSLRITMIGYAGFWTGSANAMHAFHDYSGYISLAICFVLLFSIARLMRAREFGLPDPKPNPKVAGYVTPRRVGGGMIGVLAAGVLGLGLLANVYGNPLQVREKGKLDRAGIPYAFNGWTGQDVPISDLVSDYLEKGDLLNRVYVDDVAGRQVDVFMTAAKDPEAFHDPHGCLPGGGSPIMADRRVRIDFVEPKAIAVDATMLVASGNYGNHLVLYWYMIGEESMPVTQAVWKRNRQDAISDMCRLVASPGSRHQLRQEIDGRQFMWYRFSTEIWADEQEDLDVLIDFARQFVANTKGFGE